MREVRADIVVANDISRIRGSYHEAILASRSGEVIRFKGTKEGLAVEILNLVEKVY
jgi:hypothetical protein